MRSQGTKETQGINGDAAGLQRWMEVVATSVPTGTIAACPYPRHRRADWRLAAGGPVMCGLCHPPAEGLTTVAA